MSPAFYRTIWRWHFYAGLFVMPFILLLSITGAIYLFKPQIDRWQERGYRDLPVTRIVTPDVQVQAALAAHPGASFSSYRVPPEAREAAMVHIGLPGGTMRDVYVAPDGRVLDSRDPDSAISAFVRNLHGSLLIGLPGDMLVELAGSWAIVMIVTGMYLWWPRGRGMAGIVYPRLGRQGARLRDLHAVTGFWVSGFALVLLVSGLPWASVWGNAFRMVRAEFHLTKGPPDWHLRDAAQAEHAEHDHGAMPMGTPHVSLALLPAMVAHARAERLAFPALVKPPGTVEAHGPMRGIPSTTWKIASEAQNRTLVRSVDYDMTGREVARIGWNDKHPIDKAVNYGISWHEGQLFGWVNQLIGLLTAAAMATMVVTSFLLWRRRRPEGSLGAPPLPAVPARIGGVAAIIAVLALLMPMLALSLIVVFAIERLVLTRVPNVRDWLGLAPAA